MTSFRNLYFLLSCVWCILFSRPVYEHFTPFAFYNPSRIKRLLSPCFCCSPLSRKRGDIKSHSSVCPSLCPSVTKTLTLAITFALLQVELWYLARVFFVTRPFRWYHVMTLTVTFDLLQGQMYCRAGGAQFYEFACFFIIWAQGLNGYSNNSIEMHLVNTCVCFMFHSEVKF